MPRNGSGTFTLVTGNPVSPGTTIESAWANTTLSDIGTEITNSLSRTGAGGMLAAFRLADGTLAAPGVAFLNETGTGFYRAGSGEMWNAVQGIQIQQYTTGGVLIPTGKTFTAQGASTFSGALSYTSTLTGGTGVVNLGSGQFYKSATGDVGIGTATPAAKLQVVGGNVLLDNTTGLAIKTAGGASCDAVKLTAADILQIGGGGATTAVQMWTGGVERTRVDASGNVVIGAPTAVEKVTLNQGNYYAIRTGGAKLRLADQFNEISLESVPVGSGSDAIIKTSATERLRVDQNGTLGVGVVPSAWNSSAKAFQFNTRSAIFGFSDDTHVAQNVYYDSVGYKYIATTGAASNYRQTAGQHLWFNAPAGTAGAAISFTQAMTLDASGRLGIGQTSPQTALGFANAATISWGATNYPYISGDQSANTLIFGTQATERARITSGGDLLVGDTNGGLQNSYSTNFTKASGYWTVNHASGSPDTSRYFYFGYNGSEIGSITQSGTTSVAYNTSSDYRLKDNPQPLTGSGAFIDALQPKTWDWKADGSRGVGFLAHEAQAVSPRSVVGEKDAVDQDGKPIMQAMEYGSAEFIAHIIAELQNLRARVAALEA
ncbi:Intramolecular chaperone auto-processing domain containing protein [uncultured Caudovirales phage]|uniref:Intramolecular chaperone auto-processing domain containing protein n=1 Tax=uncultured Caudovirales phage TaxID=2100421 RepID=A0A6J5N1T4_9CAUD|nr:Intramolecular chaperone auto-processing domain containing protein [uncultured Caudovirales phage]